MSCYTCITENRGKTHISQHYADTPEQALQEHISSLPFVIGINPIGDELYWIQNVALGKLEITLNRYSKCKQVWKWSEGENYSPPYTTFIIKTDEAK